MGNTNVMNRNELIQWYSDAITSEIEKNEGDIDMGMICECTSILSDLNKNPYHYSEEYLKKQCISLIKYHKK